MPLRCGPSDGVSVARWRAQRPASLRQGHLSGDPPQRLVKLFLVAMGRPGRSWFFPQEQTRAKEKPGTNWPNLTTLVEKNRPNREFVMDSLVPYGFHGTHADMYVCMYIYIYFSIHVLFGHKLTGQWAKSLFLAMFFMGVYCTFQLRS